MAALACGRRSVRVMGRGRSDRVIVTKVVGLGPERTVSRGPDRLIVEADGRRWHTARQAMADDRRRDRIAAANGWVVIRVTWDDVVTRPAAIVGEIRRIADARQGRAA